MEGEVRIDKWLWAVRVFKTRTLAAKACTAGKVLIASQPIKPSRCIRVGDVISADNGSIVRTLKVSGLIENRVGAQKVPEFVEELTPPEEIEKAKERREEAVAVRPKGTGRPTKKERRQLFQLIPWEQ